MIKYLNAPIVGTYSRVGGPARGGQNSGVRDNWIDEMEEWPQLSGETTVVVLSGNTTTDS